MTAPRRFEGGTPFLAWLREQDEIDSSKGYLATDVDLVWRNGTTWMILEEKRQMAEMKTHQKVTLHALDLICQGTPGYKGFHLLQFENHGPEDGAIFLDGVEISKDQLMRFLQFEAPEEIYQSLKIQR